MKHKGSTFPYKSERDKELMRAFRKEALTCRQVTMDTFRRVADSPCSRFWVTEERAAIVIQKMMSGRFHCVGKCKAEMYDEIFSRVMRMKKENPYMPMSKLVFFAVNSPAPKFYLSPGHVCSIIKSLRFVRTRLL